MTYIGQKMGAGEQKQAQKHLFRQHACVHTPSQVKKAWRAPQWPQMKLVPLSFSMIVIFFGGSGSAVMFEDVRAGAASPVILAFSFHQQVLDDPALPHGT
jgi:hypothetical protein